ncbi:TPR repeat-containing protein C19B12.01 [Golovinomyces cichoracearum]|uniref:TPR repeat-containing protein C19B12.01 n=1 Tax=Golovinomyces cichoracearum TaxID=62708 RepID=A0A420IHQ1_9PEZI|nr:TPR repeat-containing protein C19B12.01 [Golovinomyces cichoracearum]
MTFPNEIFRDKSLDNLLFDLEALKDIPSLCELVTDYIHGDFDRILRSSTSQGLYNILADNSFTCLSNSKKELNFHDDSSNELVAIHVFITGLSAFNAFLQANITGPYYSWDKIFPQDKEVKKKFLASLDVDGNSIYQETPHVELFCLARFVFSKFFPCFIEDVLVDCKLMSLRVNVFHQRLLFSFSGRRLVDSNLLQDTIDEYLINLEEKILGSQSTFSIEQKVQFSLEKAQIYIIQGIESKARKNIDMAKEIAGFNYALSGALGKRTKFQQTDISQLVVFAKSKKNREKNILEKSSVKPHEDREASPVMMPQALELNNDTLLESIQFAKGVSEIPADALPSELVELQPDDQPQLDPLDQIILLTEATLKDKFSPLDQLRSEEILPYATRVLNDKPTNWQIYTQALLVRSRIEFHRSRTIERSILQLQLIVDQIAADTQENSLSTTANEVIPEIKVTTFLPKAKPSESAPVQERLKYVFSMNALSKWELETELAFAWSAAGSFVSALNIFKRLHMWAEVALCYHSVNQEDKARQIVRRQLYFSKKGEIMDKYEIDDDMLADEGWEGEVRPNPPHAPRLWCILGDLNDDPSCWERAWEISRYRYPRAQRSLGEYFIKLGKLGKAREAYYKASVVHRQNADTWSRLGDLDLKLGNWEGSIYAFQQCIMLDDTNAKTYSNLGSTLLAKHAWLTSSQKDADTSNFKDKLGFQNENDKEENMSSSEQTQDPTVFLRQALRAYKRAANLAYTNWKIWDNVLTISLRLSPPSYPDLLLALRNIIRIRAPSIGENSIDADALRFLINEVIRQQHVSNNNLSEASEASKGIYTPPRGSLAFVTLQFLREDITPLLTTRTDIYELLEKIDLYRNDYFGALENATKAWRSIIHDKSWLQEVSRWNSVVESTIRIVDALQNYGPMPSVTTTTKDITNNSGKSITYSTVESAWKQKAKKAIKSVLGKAQDVWEDSDGWGILQQKLDDLSHD